MQTQSVKLIQRQLDEIRRSPTDIYSRNLFRHLPASESRDWMQRFLTNLEGDCAHNQLSTSASLLVELAEKLPGIESEIDDLFMVSAGILNVIEEVSADSFTLEMEDAWVDYFCQVIDLVG